MGSSMAFRLCEPRLEAGTAHFPGLQCRLNRKPEPPEPHLGILLLDVRHELWHSTMTKSTELELGGPRLTNAIRDSSAQVWQASGQPSRPGDDVTVHDQPEHGSDAHQNAQGTRKQQAQERPGKAARDHDA